MHEGPVMELYDQETEARLLTRLLGRLPDTTVVDVGAAQGSFVQVLLAAGADAVYAFEPYPENVEALRAAFRDCAAVRIFDVALGALDEPARLHVVRDKTGRHDEAYHTLVTFDETPTLRIVGDVPVRCRTLGGLVAEGVLPPKVGIVKIDTERSDFAVLQGMGCLFSAIVMIEYWDDLPETVGPAPYRVADVAAYMAEHGFSSYALVKRHDQFETLQINCSDTCPGDWGNVVFVHDSVLSQVAPILFEEAALVHTRLVDAATSFASEAQSRQVLLDEARHEADERLAAMGELRRVADERLAAMEARSADVEEMRRVAEERLAAMDELRRIADERLAALERRSADVEEMRLVAEERRDRLIEVHRAAAERQATIDELQQRLMCAVAGAAALRLDVLEEQELALEAYLRGSAEDGIWRWVEPGLGVLSQHAPIPLHVPEQYLSVVPPDAPPVISIVTPTLNAAQFLASTLVSVLDQGYPRLEYILQDGGSADRTMRIVERHASKLAHVDSRSDAGMAEAINRGFAHATGEIMAYLNADDLLMPGTLACVAAYFEAHPEVDVLYGHRILIDAHDGEIGRWVLPRHDDAVLSWADYVPQETLFWRRRIWERSGAEMDETFQFALDWDLLLRFRDAGARFTRLPRFLSAFRVHAAQKTSGQLHGLGSAEMERIRTRVAGRPVSGEEIWNQLRGYMYRHKVYHKLYRLGVLRY